MLRKLLVICALALLPLCAQAADVAKLAAAYAEPTLGAASPVDHLTIRVANMTMELTSGVAAPVLAGETRIGTFFNGQGRYTYKTADAVEKPAVLFESKVLRREARAENDGSITVRGDFKQLYLRSTGVEVPELSGKAPGGPLAQAFREHREHFDKARWAPPSHWLIRQQLDAPGSPMAIAEFGGRDDAYLLDSFEEKVERLVALVTRASDPSMPDDIRHALFPIVVSEQPAGRKRGAFVQPPFLLVNVDYTLTAEVRDAAKLTLSETVVPRTGPQSAFRFDLLSGVWDTDGQYRRVSVNAVTDGSGHPLPFHFQNNSILVGTPKAVAPGEELTIRFDLSGNFLPRPGGDNYWLLGLGPWFPQPSWNGQYFTTHSVVKVRKPWIAFTAGSSSVRREEGDYNVLESTVEKPIQFAAVIAGKYSMVEEKHEDLTVRVASYGTSNDRACAQLGRLAYKIIKFYEPVLGPFPFKEFNIVEINDVGWGQAPAGTMFITSEAFAPLINVRNRYYSRGINQRFAHEIAHQYWGTVVKFGTDEEQWLSEAFAEYCSLMVVKEIDGQNGVDNLMAQWRADAKAAGDAAPIPLANRIVIPNDPVREFEIRNGLLYSKGAWTLAALRKQLGDEKFFLLLRNLQGRYAWRFVTTPNVVDLLNRLDAGKNYQPFFDKSFWGTALPE